MIDVGYAFLICAVAGAVGIFFYLDVRRLLVLAWADLWPATQPPVDDRQSCDGDAGGDRDHEQPGFGGEHLRSVEAERFHEVWTLDDGSPIVDVIRNA